MGKTYVIAGAGFRGFCDAVELMKEPGAKVHVIDPAPFFGGIAYSRDVKGFVVDKGVHVFDSIPKDLADIVNEIMEGKTLPVDFVSQSAFNGVVTEGFSLPDLSSLDDATKSRIAYELIRLAADPPTGKPANLESLLKARYGETAGGIFGRIFGKVYGIGPEVIEPHGISQTSMGRLKFLDDPEMLVLKAHPWLETVLAARRKTMGKIDDYVSIYPSTGEAMRGWCVRAAEWLKAKGAGVWLGEKILGIQDTASGVSVKTDKRTLEADKVIWANDNVTSLAAALGFEDYTNKLQHGTPMVFATLITRADKIKTFTYLQNFDPEGITYRTAAAGIFGNQVRPDGTTFITCECPIRPGSERWEKAETLGPAIWAEVKALGLVKPDAEMIDCDIIRIPVTFKLPKVGYTGKIEEFRQDVAKRTRRVLLRNVIPFFRREIYLDSLNLRGLVA
jgi:hypothetical protein